MASGQGTATVDFGGFPGSNEASVSVTGQGSIGAGSKVEAFIMGDDTSTSHSANDHRYLGCYCNFTCGTPTAGVGFTIYARSLEKVTGDWTVRWVWAD
jgi:hypothetical protein